MLFQKFEMEDGIYFCLDSLCQRLLVENLKLFFGRHCIYQLYPMAGRRQMDFELIRKVGGCVTKVKF